MNSPTNSGPAAHAAGPAPYATLFVCTGNIARSASAELLARHRSPEDSRLVFASAGTAAVVGSPVAEEVGAELRERGVPFGEHRAQQLTGEMIRHADIVLAMEGHHRQWILDEWPAAVGKTFLLKHAARNLSAAHAPVSGMTDPAVWLRSHAAAGQPGDGIADPFRKGNEAARRAVTEIQDAIGELLPALHRWVDDTARSS